MLVAGIESRKIRTANWGALLWAYETDVWEGKAPSAPLGWLSFFRRTVRAEPRPPDDTIILEQR
jgi:phosphatidylserine decarboxylase